MCVDSRWVLTKRWGNRLLIDLFRWINLFKFIFVSLYTILKMRCTFNIYIVNFLSPNHQMKESGKQKYFINMDSRWVLTKSWGNRLLIDLFRWINLFKFIFVSLYTILITRCTFNILYIVNFLQIIKGKNQENKNISSTRTRGECWQKDGETDCWLIFYLFRCIQSWIRGVLLTYT
jgi:hypothetical protein